METYTTHFSDDDLALLRQLVGGEWLYVAGDTLGPDWHTPEEVLVGTSNGSLAVISDLFEADFQGFVMTYAALSVSEDVGRFGEAKRLGNVYVQHQHEALSDIQVVRETITETVQGVPSWEYTTDVGLVFVLAHGCISVSKGSHHTEMLVVSMARDTADLDIPDRSVEWADDLIVSHRSSRQFYSIAGGP